MDALILASYVLKANSALPRKASFEDAYYARTEPRRFRLVPAVVAVSLGLVILGFWPL
jgi:hypothetical protein